MNRELDTTILIVTHDADIAYKVGRVVLIRDGKTSAEIRRKVSLRRVAGQAERDEPLEEFTLVDGAGRVQIPGQYLDKLKIRERARVTLDDGQVTISPGDI